MKKFEPVVKVITVLIFTGALVYGLVMWDFATAAKCAFGVFACFLPDVIYTIKNKFTTLSR